MILCKIGLHKFEFPPHSSPYNLWEDFYVECERGCGARNVLRCHDDTHWIEKHPNRDE